MTRSALRVATLEECVRYGSRGGDRARARGLLPPIAGAVGLAIDASTPAYASTTALVSTLTSVSFTPPAGSLLTVLYSNSGGAASMNKPTNSAGAVTWDSLAAISEVANSAGAAVWRGVVTTSAAMTLTVTTSAAHNDWGFGILVVTGQAATQNGATNVNTSTSGTVSQSFTTVAANSLIVGCGANFSNGTVGTPGTGQSLTFNAHAFSMSDTSLGGAAWAQYLTGMNLAAGVSATINDTAPTGIDYAMAMLEIVAAGTAAAPKPPTRVMQAVQRAAVR